MKLNIELVGESLDNQANQLCVYTVFSSFNFPSYAVSLVSFHGCFIWASNALWWCHELETSLGTLSRECQWIAVVIAPGRSTADEVLFKDCVLCSRGISLLVNLANVLVPLTFVKIFLFGKLILKTTHKHKSPSEVPSSFLLTPTKVPFFSKECSYFSSIGLALDICVI